MKKKTYFFIGAAIVFSFICIGAANNEVKKSDDINAVKIQTNDGNSSNPTGHVVSLRTADPFVLMRARMRNMERQMNQLFNNPFLDHGSGMNRPKFQADTPKLTFKENKSDYIMQVVTPGMDKKDLSVDVKDNVLTVSGQYKNETESKNGNKIISQQQITSNFIQSFSLPQNIDIDRITSNYTNGILSITIPKDMEKIKEKSKSISIQ